LFRRLGHRGRDWLNEHNFMVNWTEQRINEDSIVEKRGGFGWDGDSLKKSLRHHFLREAQNVNVNLEKYRDSGNGLAKSIRNFSIFLDRHHKMKVNLNQGDWQVVGNRASTAGASGVGKIGQLFWDFNLRLGKRRCGRKIEGEGFRVEGGGGACTSGTWVVKAMPTYASSNYPSLGGGGSRECSNQVVRKEGLHTGGWSGPPQGVENSSKERHGIIQKWGGRLNNFEQSTTGGKGETPG